MPCHSEGAPATEESAQPREILQSPGLPQDDMNAVEFGKLFSRDPYENETIWVPQKRVAALFDITVPTINEHRKNSFPAVNLNRN